MREIKNTRGRRKQIRKTGFGGALCGCKGNPLGTGPLIATAFLDGGLLWAPVWGTQHEDGAAQYDGRLSDGGVLGWGGGLLRDTERR